MPTAARVQLLRHATLLLEIAGKKLLLDPMLAPKDAFPPVPNAANKTRFPMVDLPLTGVELEALLQTIDAVVVTHLHPDHWDAFAQQQLRKSLPIFCQTEDEAAIRAQGFTAVQPIATQLEWEGIHIHRTSGEHGTGEIGQLMGIVSGFVFQHDAHSIYVAGDTIWCKAVETALHLHKPEIVVLNGGAAQFVVGDPITMNLADMSRVCAAAPQARVLVVHLDTVNHCYETRSKLAEATTSAALEIPADGEIVELWS